MKKDQLRHEKLIDFLSQFPKYQSEEGQPRLKKQKEKINFSDFDKVSFNDTNDAVKVIVDFLNLSNGSTGNFDLYRLLEAYFSVPECRDKINDIVNEAHSLKYQKSKS